MLVGAAAATGRWNVSLKLLACLSAALLAALGSGICSGSQALDGVCGSLERVVTQHAAADAGTAFSRGGLGRGCQEVLQAQAVITQLGTEALVLLAHQKFHRLYTICGANMCGFPCP